MTRLIVARTKGADVLAVSLDAAIQQGRVVVILDQRRGDRRKTGQRDHGMRAGQRRRSKPVAFVGLVLDAV
jgi:hypothetical protein